MLLLSPDIDSIGIQCQYSTYHTYPTYQDAQVGVKQDSIRINILPLDVLHMPTPRTLQWVPIVVCGNSCSRWSDTSPHSIKTEGNKCYRCTFEVHHHLYSSSDIALASSSLASSSVPVVLCASSLPSWSFVVLYWSLDWFPIVIENTHRPWILLWWASNAALRVKALGHPASGHFQEKLLTPCRRRCRVSAETSPKDTEHPGYSHWYGFSPVWTREWTDKAER